MKIHAGYEISYDCQQPTPMILLLSVHPSRRKDLITPDTIKVTPAVPVTQFEDFYGNVAHTLRAPAGRVTLSADFLIEDSGKPDDIALTAAQHNLEDLPPETLIYLLGSRYCETDRLSEFAWSTFGATPKGWPLVQAIVDYVHDHI